MTALIYLGLGSNRGDRLANLHVAVAALAPAVRVLRASAVYETEPWGYADQARFLNMALEAETELAPAELLQHVKQIEQQVGRVASFRYGPREIDIDILLYGDQQSLLGGAEQALQIPHPRLAERAFVLVPLAELAPELPVPGSGSTVSQLLAAQDASGVVPYSGQPTRSQKLLFWLLLTLASTFFAEVISGASPFVFFSGWGLLVTTPLYGLHTLVLAALAFRKGVPRFSTLFFVALLFGLYEAYITKVLWSPPWFTTVKLIGVDLFAFSMLVPYWHAFLSFIVPLLFVESVALRQAPVRANLPARGRAWLAGRRPRLLAAAFFGALQAAGQPAGQAFVSALMNGAVLAAVVWLWRRSAGRRFTLQELLPRRRSLLVVLILLAALYLATGFWLLPENLPGVAAQLFIVCIYALVLLAIRRSEARPSQAPAADTPRPWLERSVVLAYLAAALLTGFVPQELRNLLFLINGLGGSIFGLWVLVYSLRELRRV